MIFVCVGVVPSGIWVSLCVCPAEMLEGGGLVASIPSQSRVRISVRGGLTRKRSVGRQMAL